MKRPAKYTTDDYVTLAVTLAVIMALIALGG
jgi:hypothetical protein